MHCSSERLESRFRAFHVRQTQTARTQGFRGGGRSLSNVTEAGSAPSDSDGPRAVPTAVHLLSSFNPLLLDSVVSSSTWILLPIETQLHLCSPKLARYCLVCTGEKKRKWLPPSKGSAVPSSFLSRLSRYVSRSSRAEGQLGLEEALPASWSRC